MKTVSGGQHADLARDALHTRGLDRRFQTDDGQLRPLAPQRIDGSGGSRVARYDDHLAALVDKPSHGLSGEARDLLPRASAVGTVLAVAQIRQRLVGQRAI